MVLARNFQKSKQPKSKWFEALPCCDSFYQCTSCGSTCHSHHATSYHDEILRTGQCLVPKSGDIIITAGINSGSEVIASGNIHIYGSARGRVIAGAGGNRAARIFCHFRKLNWFQLQEHIVSQMIFQRTFKT